MKIEIEITEEVAACLWANHNPCRHSTAHRFRVIELPEIVKGLAEFEAARFRELGSSGVQRAQEDFRGHRGKTDATEKRASAERCRKHAAELEAEAAEMEKAQAAEVR